MERLRGQLRETAQRGQASDYGGDRIEDTAARGAYQTRRGVADLLKKKKSARDRLPDKKPRTPDPSTPPESPSDPPAPSELPAREQPRIKTREAVSAREGGAGVGPTESGGTGPSSGARMKQARIKTREPAVHDLRPDVRLPHRADRSYRGSGKGTPLVRPPATGRQHLLPAMISQRIG